MRKMNFFGFESIDNTLPIVNPQPVVEPREQDDIISTLCAPDPLTGLPDSGLAIAVTRTSEPAVREYIQSVLLKPNPDSDVKAVNADDALELIRHAGEFESAYDDRLTSIIQSHE